MRKVAIRPAAGLLAFTLCLLAGCATSYNVATQHNESLVISTQKEVELGEAVAKQVQKEFTIIRDPNLLARLDRVGQRVAAVVDRKELTYRFNIFEEKEGETLPNAFALPGGPIYITASLMNLLKSDDELAAVLGHELGHVQAKHAIKRLQGAMGLQLLEILAATAGGARKNPGTLQGVDLALASVLTEYSQADELEADRLGVRYLEKAGYRPGAALDALTHLRDYLQKQPERRYSYFRTHPYFADRLRVIRQESQGKLTFDDYINIKQ